MNTLVRPLVSFPLTEHWQVTLGESTYERPVYYEGMVWLPGVDWLETELYALEVDTGKIIWLRPIALYNFLRCVTNSYLVLSGSGPLVILQTKTGDTVWQKEREPYQAICNQSTVFSSGAPETRSKLSIWPRAQKFGKEQRL